MVENYKLIYLDQYEEEFRRGYDAACTIQAIRDLLKLYFTENTSKSTFINIHKNSLSLCQGLCAENLFYSEVKNPPSEEDVLKNVDEIWLLIKPSKLLKR